MFTAWQAAKLSRVDKLEPLGKYLDQLKPQKPRTRQSPADMIAAMLAIKATVRH